MAVLEQVAEAESRFAASRSEWDRRTLVQTGQHAMHAGLRGLFASYNGQRVHVGRFVALPAQEARQPASAGPGRETLPQC